MITGNKNQSLDIMNCQKNQLTSAIICKNYSAVSKYVD